MKNILFAIVLAAIPATLPAQEFSTATMRPITLGEACALSLAKSETLAQQTEGIKQLEAAERQIASAFRPSFDLNANQYKQENIPSVTKGYVSGGYSLFSGMRDYIAVKASAAKTGAASLALERARQELYLGVTHAYLNLFSAQQEVFIRLDQIKVTAKRITELEAREDIGRSRKSEVVAARTQLAQDKANYLNSAAAERLAQQALIFLTGLEADLAPAELLQRNGESLETYLKTVLSRPDVAASRKTLEAYDYLADIQDRNLWPTVNLSADYYVLHSRVTSPADWDGAVALKVPLYTGGTAQAQKDSANAAKRSAALALQLVERQALTEVRSAHEEHKYSILQEASLKDALALAQDNARYQQEDYKLGLVTNLDVLSALNSVLQTRLALSQAKVQERLTLLTLETAAGMEIK